MEGGHVSWHGIGGLDILGWDIKKLNFKLIKLYIYIDELSNFQSF